MVRSGRVRVVGGVMSSGYMVRGVLPTFETVVMYGHFNESPVCLVSSNRRERSKISSFLQGMEKWCYVNLNPYITYLMLVLLSVYNGGRLMDGGLLVA